MTSSSSLSITLELFEDFLNAVHMEQSLLCGQKLPICDPSVQFFAGTLQVAFERSDNFGNCASSMRKRQRVNDLGKNVKSFSTANQNTSSGVQQAEVVHNFKATTESSGKKVFICEFCAYRANSRSHVKTHTMVTHNPNCPKLICSYCGSKIKQKNNLKMHYMKVHKMSSTMATLAVAESKTTMNLT